MALQITQENYDEVLSSDKPILLDFWAEWCGPCKLIGPIIDEVSEDFSDTAIVGKINVDEFLLNYQVSMELGTSLLYYL